MIRSAWILTISMFAAIPAHAQTANTPADVVTGVVQAADALLGTLSDNQRKKVRFSFQDEAQRHNWSNLPEGIVHRKGLRWGDLKENQRAAVNKLIAATLSPAGVQQVIDNMDGDEVLKDVASGGGRPAFGRDEYFLSILGKPSSTTPWTWQFGGHHLAINATIAVDQITLAPSLTGGQPADFELNGRNVRQVAEEEDKAFQLIGALTTDQRQTAVLANRYAEMIWGPGREGATPMQQGICAASLTAEQRTLLIELIRERIRVLNDVHAAIAMQPVVENLDETWFAWFGPTAVGSPASYRIQGPTVLIEFVPQRLGGDPMNHIHAMYRDPTNDYGVGFVRTAR
jgi:Protein of unknown function (DUF3500)